MGYFLSVHEFIQQPILFYSILLSLLDIEELDITTFLKNLPHQHDRVLA